MTTDLDSVATRDNAILSQIKTALALIAKMEIEGAHSTAASFIVMTNELLGNSVVVESNAVRGAAKPKAKPKKRAALKKKTSAIAATATEKTAVVETVAPAITA